MPPGPEIRGPGMRRAARRSGGTPSAATATQFGGLLIADLSINPPELSG